MTTFAPLGDSVSVSVTSTDQRVTLPPMPTLNGTLRIVARQANMVALYLKLGNVTVTGSTTTSMRVRPGDIDNPLYLPIGNSETHLSIFCEGPPGTVILTAGRIMDDGAVGSGGGGAGPTGATGAQGAPGRRGFIGRDGGEGDEGAQGPPGRRGNPGAPGSTGARGPRGLGVPGPEGEQGETGDPIPGRRGLQGIQGIPGPAGARRAFIIEGADGDDGPMGVPGKRGALGAAGARGLRGSRGFDGADGDDGDVGPPGRRGPTGSSGIQGPAGFRRTIIVENGDGEEGPTGPRGPRGTNGAPGIQGPAGSRRTLIIEGEQGDEGAPGIPGRRGAAGVAGSTPTENLVILSSDFTGADVNTAQPVFTTASDTFTLTVSRTYLFEAQYWIARTAGANSHITSLLFGGTATYSAFDYSILLVDTAGAPLFSTNAQFFVTNVATATAITAANTSTTENILVRLKGVMRVTGGGSIIPQFIYSAAPGGAPVTKRGSFFRLWNVGTDTFLSSGGWF